MRKPVDQLQRIQGVEVPYLRAWRFYKLMSTRALAAASGVSTNTINALENQHGRARFETIGKLARGLGITPQDLTRKQPPEITGEHAEEASKEETQGRAVA